MEKLQVARLSIASNLTLIVAKLSVGVSIGSVSVLAEAIHSSLDLLAATIAYFSIREASKPADEKHPFGHGKIENISGTVEAFLVFVAAGWIIFEATERLHRPGRLVEPLPGLIVMGASAALNWFVSAKLIKTARATDSVALEANALHLRTDVWTSLGVFGGLLAIKLTGLQILDPLIALGVALFILKAAYDMTRTSFLPLLDISLPEHEQQAVRQVLEGFRDRYLEVHMLRTRKAGPERHIDLHMVLPKSTALSEAHYLCDEIEAALAGRLPNAQVLIHVEPCEYRGHGRCEDAECKLCLEGKRDCDDSIRGALIPDRE